MPKAVQRQILVVDDDPAILDIIAVRLRDAGYQVKTVDRAKQALMEMKTNRYDLLLTDLDMPGMDGFGLIQHIRHVENLIDFPIIVITSSSDSDACTRAFHAGATNFTTKPINWTLLGGQISYVLRNADRESALRDARKTAERATALRDNLMAIVGHELRTPLNAMLGFTKMLCDEVHGPLGADEYKDYVSEIAQAGHRLNGLVSDALLTSRLETGTEAVDISDNDALEVLKPVFKDMAVFARKRGQLLDVRDVADDLAVQCDTRLFQTATRHLIRNAIEHCARGSAIKVSCQKVAEGMLSLTVDDTGPGIPVERLEHLSKPLVQGDDGLTRTSSGLGFGLSIAKAVAELHGGTLKLSNRPVGGLHVDLQIPAYEISYSNTYAVA